MMPDFREKQIVFFRPEFGKDVCLRIKNQNIALERDGKIVNQVATEKALSVFVLGEISFTSVLLRKCLENGVSVFFLKRNLETYATVGAAAEGNYLLREKQYALSSARGLTIAKHIVKNKIRNQFRLIREREGGSRNPAEEELLSRLAEAEALQSLLGIEGGASRYFFRSYFSEMNWRRRIPRGKADPENILLDIGYSMLFNYVDSLLRLFGFDTYRGIYHQLFFQRKSLSCDIEEPFRCIIDRKLLKMHNLGQIRKEDFQYSSKRKQYFLGYKESPRYAQLFMEAILERKEEIYSYVRDFYYAILNGTDDFPEFDIRKPRIC